MLVQQLADQLARSEQTSTAAANTQGLLYSGALGKRIGELKIAHTDRVGTAQRELAQREAARAGELDTIRNGLPFQELALRLASMDRAAQRSQNDALVPTNLPAAATDALGIPRAQGHSPRYVGPGWYRHAGPTDRRLRARGHSIRYRGPGHYVRVKG